MKHNDINYGGGDTHDNDESRKVDSSILSSCYYLQSKSIKVIEQAHHLTHHEKLHHTKRKRHQASLLTKLWRRRKNLTLLTRPWQKNANVQRNNEERACHGSKALITTYQANRENVLLDALEGRHVGHSLKNHNKQAALSSLRGQRKRRVR